MKKVLSIMMVVAMLAVCSAQAEGIDLSAMTYQDLVILQQRINKEIMSRPEWKEVTVPVGTWKVGEDIPAGTYSIKGVKYMATLTIHDGKETKNNENGSLVDIYMLSAFTDDSIGRLLLKDGYIVEISGESLVFAPPVSLGF